MSPNPPPAEHLAGLVARATEADGQPPFSDQSLVELGRGERVLLASDHGAALVSGIGERAEAGVADAVVVQAQPEAELEAELELVVHPDWRGRGEGAELVRRALATIEVQSPSRRDVFAWAHGDHPASRALAARFGFEPVRTLLQLRAELAEAPVPAVAAPESASAARLRPFRPGLDDAAWLALNARAFAQHPEQGRLTQRDLDDRLAEPWFDADDFLLVHDGADPAGDLTDDRPIGFCWLKVERGIGEIYAIGVDPAHHGKGLGRVLMEAGLARLAARGIRTAALYVEADNAAALALYARYGFAQHTIDVRYRLAR